MTSFRRFAFFALPLATVVACESAGSDAATNVDAIEGSLAHARACAVVAAYRATPLSSIEPLDALPFATELPPSAIGRFQVDGVGWTYIVDMSQKGRFQTATGVVLAQWSQFAGVVSYRGHNGLNLSCAEPSMSDAGTLYLASIDPGRVVRSTSAKDIKIYGSGFSARDVASFDGNFLETQWFGGYLRATLLPEHLQGAAGPHSVVVYDELGNASPPFQLVLENAQPVLSRVQPDSIAASTAPVTFRLEGKDFAPTSRVYVDDAEQVPTTVTHDTITVSLTLATGRHKIRVDSPMPGGGFTDRLEIRVQ